MKVHGVAREDFQNVGSSLENRIEIEIGEEPIPDLIHLVFVYPNKIYWLLLLEKYSILSSE